jgi:N-acetylglucosaminyldiphosphoundecaprenol N-acetyl-beta-D-mannosaminyltransferase
MGAVAWMRMAGLPVRPGHRTTYADWLPALLARAAGRRIAVVGGSPAAAGRIAGTMAQRHPDLPFLIHHGFFAMDPGSEESRERIADLRSFRPDWLFLAMGMPRQEAWLQAVHAHLPPCLVFQAGAAFDYYAGIVPTPPRFLGRIGLEWAFRLAREPRRLAHRYLVEPFRLAGPLLGLRLRGRTRLLRRAGPGRGSTETAGTGSARP